ncbi:MAG: hypothetical protein HOO86_09960 [Bacteroidales bacterium]|nr:hypothetical protein [Bacteroidales bacterium]
MAEYIDVTPTWAAMVPTFLLIIDNGNADGRKTVEGELFRMAKLADLYVASQKVKS